MLILAVLVYAIALIAANLIVAQLGPAVSPVLAFLFIGLDLSLRDWLHVRLRWWEMLALIVSTGLLTLVLNPAADRIALASATAFLSAALVDWSVFARLRGVSWLTRSNSSNVAAALVDSIIFPTLAFGVLMPQIIVLQFVAKVAGGALWALWLRRTVEQRA